MYSKDDLLLMNEIQGVYASEYDEDTTRLLREVNEWGSLRANFQELQGEFDDIEEEYYE
jgi:hypothetical protein